MRADKHLGIVSRKKVKWLLAPMPGKHGKNESISAGVLLRDVFGKASSIYEAKKILNAGNLLVDGKKVKEAKCSIGLMDVISQPAEKKSFAMKLVGKRLEPKEVAGEAAGVKYLKVIGKNVVGGGKVQLAFHDGRVYLGDNQVKTGDTLLFAIPSFKLAGHLKFAPGCLCLVTQGKHIGEVAKLEKVIERPGSHESEAKLAGKDGDFVTLVKYLFVVDEKY